METKLVKSSDYYYLIETWNSVYTKWDTHLVTDTLKDAHKDVEYLVEQRGFKNIDIKVSRITNYDTFSKESEEYYTRVHYLKDELKEVLSQLEEIRDRGYIPWTSPAPSTSEYNVKREVNKAINALYDAILNC